MTIKWIYAGKVKGVEKFFCVDEHIYEKIKDKSFRVDQSNTAVTSKKIDGKIHYVKVTSFIFENHTEKKIFVEFLNKNSLDLRLCNLRITNLSEMKRKITSKGYSKTFDGKYLSRIKIDKKYKHLGMFDTKEEARAAYIGACKALDLPILEDLQVPDVIEPTHEEKVAAIIAKINTAKQNLRIHAMKLKKKGISVQNKNGKTYKTLREAGREWNVKSDTILSWVKKGKNGFFIS